MFADSEGKQYVAKLKENNQGLRVLANEFCVNKLADFLDVPSPKGAFATFPECLKISSSCAQLFGGSQMNLRKESRSIEEMNKTKIGGQH